MGDEAQFKRAVEIAGNFSKNYMLIKIYHPTLPGCYIEVDNLAQKDNFVLIAEGKAKDEATEVAQLQVRNLSVKINSAFYIKNGLLNKFQDIRLFFIVLKRKS